MKAHLKQIRISPKKVNVVAGLVRGKEVIKALDMLKFMPKKAAGHLYKVIHSAAANAETNDKQKRENLRIKEIVVNKGLFLKRFLPSTRGRALPLHKPTTHISVTLEKK
ncbi:50S ribosomal protein L22 [Candidatus Gracilibacteria bacterium]|nr:50S ribosomal protein L22 [Candidatus Gracilibacteria bacterium]MCF7819092.1 50S ribosomal protein L22 [Candidatus Gracilibacteria bacterium]